MAQAGLVTEDVDVLRAAVLEIEQLDTFRRDAVMSAGVALDTRSNARCVYALEEIFRKGSRR